MTAAIKPARSACPRSPLVIPTTMPVTTPAQIGLAGTPHITTTAAIWTRLRQFSRKKLPMARNADFQKQPMKQ